MPPANSVTELRPAGAPRPSTRGERSQVVAYDFRRPNKLSRDHARLLQLINETFARRLTTLLTSGLRQVCQVTPRELVQESYDEYVSALPTPTLLLPLSLPPLPGTITLEFSLPVALAAIDHMLGGPGGAQQPRNLTDIETNLLGRLVEQMLGVLRYALEPLVMVEPSTGPIEYNPQFLQAAGASDSVVVAEFDMTIGRESCILSLCFPLASVLPRLNSAGPRTTRSDAGSGVVSRMRDSLSDVPVDVSVRFNPVAIDSTRVFGLTVGDVVELDHRVGAPLSVQTGNATVAHAVPGKAGNRLAALLVDNISSLPKELS